MQLAKETFFNLSVNHCQNRRLHLLQIYKGFLLAKLLFLSLNGMDAGIDTLVIEADNLTKLKRAASKLKDSLEIRMILTN